MISITEHFNRLLYALVGVAALLFLINGHWIDAVSTAAIFGLMVSPKLLKNRYKIEFPIELECAVVNFVFLALFWGSMSNFYERFLWWDIVLHAASGILLGIVSFVFLYALNKPVNNKFSIAPGFIAFFAVMFSLGLSVLWEIYEYTLDTFFGYTMQESGLPDTMGDLILNAVGAVIVAVVAYIWMRRKNRVPFTPGILQKIKTFKNKHIQKLR